MLVVVPLWSTSPPESVREFFAGGRFYSAMRNFFGPPWMAARSGPLLLLLFVAWHLPRHRKWVAAAVVLIGIGIIFTLGYIYRIKEALMVQAGGDAGSEEVRSLVSRWVWADRSRLVFMMGPAFLCLLYTLSIPFPKLEPSERSPSARSDYCKRA